MASLDENDNAAMHVLHILSACSNHRLNLFNRRLSLPGLCCLLLGELCWGMSHWAPRVAYWHYPKVHPAGQNLVEHWEQTLDHAAMPCEAAARVKTLSLPFGACAWKSVLQWLGKVCTCIYSITLEYPSCGPRPQG